MSSEKKAFQASLTALIDEERPAAAEVDVERLVAYHEGRLPAAERETLQDALVHDPAALELLADLAAFDEVSDTSEGASRLQVETTLRAVAQRRAKRQGGSRRHWPQGAFPAWALAAVLALAALGLGFWLHQERQNSARLRLEVAELRAPRPDALIHSLYPESVLRSGGVAEEALALPRESRLVVLVLTLDEAPRSVDTYEAVVRDAAGAVLWRGEITPGRHATFTLALGSSTLALGSSVVELHGRRSGESELLETFPLEVVAPEEAKD